MYNLFFFKYVPGSVSSFNFFSIFNELINEGSSGFG